MRGGISSILRDRTFISDESEKMLFFDAKKIFGWVMSEPLPHDDNGFDKKRELGDIINTPDDNAFYFFFQLDSRYPKDKQEKTENFPFCPENKFSPQNRFSNYLTDIKLTKCT